MSKRVTLRDVIFIVIGFALGILTLTTSEMFWGEQEAYERGYKHRNVTTWVISPSEIVRRVVGDDTLYFWRQQVDTGYVLKPLYRVLKPWIPEDSLGWESWSDTTLDWYSWGVSTALARDWYDGSDNNIYQDAAVAWVISVLLKESKFTIYFDSTDTLPAVEE